MSIFFALAMALQPAPADLKPLIVGETASVNALDQERAINVILPRGYEKNPEEKWPVIFFLDGGLDQDFMMGIGLERWNQLWGRSRPAIFVGIQTKDRQRELLPPTTDKAENKQYPTAGQSTAFRSWLVSDIVPMIKARYRTNGDTFLVGESAAGHFVLETWLKDPSAFNGYAAISPSLQWNGGALSRQIASNKDARPPVYLSLADEGGETEIGMLRVISTMASDQKKCFSDRRQDLRHANSMHGLLPEALQYLLPTKADWLEEYGLVLRCDKLKAIDDE